ncbi:Hypothetical protein LUCI_4054 [Lucifera butyrica]|uniref:Uncharacterized protein n=1 Tax=Lucifera butyrica TaxID=1351585 RepID=A0A498RFA6_9FIRM|nr:hypothetical protein [Lucifera butyrica]VBB08773.1 Hypothetical protein LUCI_4054 [Lucifera butyrica]
MSDTPDKSVSLIQSITKILDNVANNGAGYDALINIMSLMCLITILNRSQPAALPVAAANSNSAGMPVIQKLLGDLLKNEGGAGPGGGGGGGADALMSLLPLLSNSQLKSKLNPSNMATILNLVNSLSGSLGDKPAKADKPAKTELKEVQTEPKADAPAAAITSTQAEHVSEVSASILNYPEESDKKTSGKYLNWKSSF